MLDDVKRKSARDNDFLLARIRTLEAESQAKIEIMREESERRKEREDQLFETKLGYLNVESKLRRKLMTEENERSVRSGESKSAGEIKASELAGSDGKGSRRKEEKVLNVDEKVEEGKDGEKTQQERLDEFFAGLIRKPKKKGDAEEYQRALSMLDA